MEQRELNELRRLLLAAQEEADIVYIMAVLLAVDEGRH